MGLMMETINGLREWVLNCMLYYDPLDSLDYLWYMARMIHKYIIIDTLRFVN